jgi:hypothetical protein
MNIKQKYDSVKKTITETFRPKSGIILNVSQANQRIAELEKQLETKVSPVTSTSSTGASDKRILSTDSPSQKEVKFELAKAKIAEVEKSKQSAYNAEKSKQDGLLLKSKSYGDKITMLDLESSDILQAKMAALDAQENLRKSIENRNKTKRDAELDEWKFRSQDRMSTSETYYLPSKGYYICYETLESVGKVLVMKEGSKNCDILIHRPSGYAEGASNTTYSGPNMEYVDKEEFLEILGSKPSWDELCKVYYRNGQNAVTMNVNKPTVIYG